jgi:hypothetical protein
MRHIRDLARHREGAMAYDERTKLEALRDQMETYGRGANYLLVGHGVGFAGCLSIVKERPDLSPPFQSVSFLVILFGTGLLLGAAFWFFSMIFKISVTQDIIAQTPHWLKAWGHLKNRLMRLVLNVSLWGSMGLFVLAMSVIMYPFRDGIYTVGRWVTGLQ